MEMIRLRLSEMRLPFRAMNEKGSPQIWRTVEIILARKHRFLGGAKAAGIIRPIDLICGCAPRLRRRKWMENRQSDDYSVKQKQQPRDLVKHHDCVFASDFPWPSGESGYQARHAATIISRKDGGGVVG